LVGCGFDAGCIELRDARDNPIQFELTVESTHYWRARCTVQEAVIERLKQMKRTRWAEECAQRDPKAEQAMAEEALSAELKEWPAY
jgi:hypothetical protein